MLSPVAECFLPTVARPQAMDGEFLRGSIPLLPGSKGSGATCFPLHRTTSGFKLKFYLLRQK